ncbi:MAG: restriction endonuclease subunit S [Pseudomonadota bacterium]
MVEGWETHLLGSFMDFKNGLNADKGAYGRGTKFVNVMDIFESAELYADFVVGSVTAPEKLVREYSVEFGDILFNRTSETPEDIACASVYLDKSPITFGGFVIRGRQFSKVLDPKFCQYAFQAENVRREFIRRGQGAVRANIGQQDLSKVPISVPPLPEQRRIAEILRTWDEAIEKLEALRAAKERRLHILREKLTYADVEHEPMRLGDVTEEVTTRNGAGVLDREKVMGVTNSRGIVPMREQTIAGDISRYKIVADQSFAYNPMRINVGSIARNQTGEEILVSPDYVAFACSPDGLLPDYLDHLRNTKWWAHYINSGGSGSVRQRTYYGDLAAMKVPLPAVAEQRRIADALNTAQRDAETTFREITALQRQKRGLMQKLLTGEWRVSTEQTTEAAE